MYVYLEFNECVFEFLSTGNHINQNCVDDCIPLNYLVESRSFLEFGTFKACIIVLKEIYTR